MEQNDLFDYGLKIYQNSNYFKFSLDSILLGEFIKLKPHFEILDICTGNAPTPLILSTKQRDITIDAVEIQKEVYELGKKSIEENGLESIIHIFNKDVRKHNLKKYDVVLANPPYFKVTDTSQKNENKVKSIARHELTLTLENVIDIAKRTLKENGTFYMVHRIERFLDTIDLLERAKFGIRRVVFVHTKSNTKAEIFLIEASNYKKSDMKVYSLNIQGLKTYKDIFKEW